MCTVPLPPSKSPSRLFFSSSIWVLSRHRHPPDPRRGRSEGALRGLSPPVTRCQGRPPRCATRGAASRSAPLLPHAEPGASRGARRVPARPQPPQGRPRAAPGRRRPRLQAGPLPLRSAAPAALGRGAGRAPDPPQRGGSRWRGALLPGPAGRPSRCLRLGPVPLRLLHSDGGSASLPPRRGGGRGGRREVRRWRLPPGRRAALPAPTAAEDGAGRGASLRPWLLTVPPQTT